MNWARWERFAPLTGALAVVLWVIGIWLVNGPGNLPGSDDTPDKILAAFTDHSRAIQLGAWLVIVGALAFLWFVGSLRSAVFVAEGGTGRVASIVTFGGVATGIFVLLLHAPSFAAAQVTKHLTPQAAQALLVADDVFFYAAQYAIVVLFLASAVAVFRWRVFPIWLGWVSLVFGIAALIPRLGWAILIFGFPIWTLIASWLLYARPVAASGPPGQPPGPPPHTEQFVGTE